ncbi:MAG: copper chaperone PCu(A)C [Pseudomonadota bacterium]
MKFSGIATSIALVLGTCSAAFAQDITIEDPFARASSPAAKSGAAFMVIANAGDEDDRLIAAESDVAARVELHTHMQDANGVMRMIEVEDGMAVPAGGSHALERGGDHVMFMGLTGPFVQGETVSVTLIFEKAGPISVDIPIDLNR